MPKINGIDFIKRQIEKQCRICKVAFISAYWNVDYLNYAESIDAAIFHKPFTVEDLHKWINQNIPKSRKDMVLGNEFLKAKSGTIPVFAKCKYARG